MAPCRSTAAPQWQRKIPRLRCLFSCRDLVSSYSAGFSIQSGMVGLHENDSALVLDDAERGVSAFVFFTVPSLLPAVQANPAVRPGRFVVVVAVVASDFSAVGEV